MSGATDICLIKNFVYFFSGLLLMGSPWSHDLSHRFEELAKVDFYFLNIFLPVLFFTFLFIGPSEFYVLSLVLDLLNQVTAKLTQDFFVWAYNKLLDRIWIQSFICCEFFKI